MSDLQEACPPDGDRVAWAQWFLDRALDTPVITVRNAFAVYVAKECRPPAAAALKPAPRIVADLAGLYVALVAKFGPQLLSESLAGAIDGYCRQAAQELNANYEKNRQTMDPPFEISCRFTNRDVLRFDVRGPADLLYQLPRFGG